MPLTAADIPFSSALRLPEGWRLLDDVEVQALPNPSWLIDTIIPQHGLTVMYGASGSCKTTLEASIGVALATGKPWYGQRVCRQGATVYVGAEDVSGWKLRLAAAKRAAGLSLSHSIGVFTFPEALDLRDPTAVGRFIRFVKDSGGAFVRVTFDTFAASTPGANENTSEDMGAAIAHAQQIRDALGLTVNIIHHTNASGSRERGHSAMRGAADLMMSLSQVDDLIHVECSKQRNAAPFERLTLKLVPVEGGGVVLRPAADVLPSATLTPIQAKVLNVLREFASAGATKSEWEKASQDVNTRSFHRAAAVLEEKLKLVQRVGTHFRLTPKALQVADKEACQ